MSTDVRVIFATKCIYQNPVSIVRTSAEQCTSSIVISDATI